MGKKIKVVFVLGCLGNGGAERTVLNILNNIDSNLFDVSLCLLENIEKNSYSNFLNKKIDITILNRRARYSILSIAKVIKKENPDIVFSTLSYMNVVVYIAHKLSYSKSKLILREANFMKKDFNMSKLSYFLVKHSYANCHKVISLSKGVKQNLKDHFNVKEEKISLIYNPIDLINIRKMQNETLDTIDKGVFKLIVCGRLTKQKNQELLIRALKKIKVGNEKWILNIVGDGEDRIKLESLVKELSLEDNIKFLGFKKNPYKYMANSDLFILSSLWEGFGHVVAEAMACGTPVLSTDCPHGPREILDNGEFGWLVANNDEKALTEKIEYLINNQNEIEIMKKKLKERVDYFDSPKIVKEYENVFLDVLNE